MDRHPIFLSWWILATPPLKILDAQPIQYDTIDDGEIKKIFYSLMTAYIAYRVNSDVKYNLR